jgi:AP-3 complex subunit beta
MDETHPELLRYAAHNFGGRPGRFGCRAPHLRCGANLRSDRIYIRFARDPRFGARDRAWFLLDKANEKIQAEMRKLLFAARKPPNWSTTDSSSNNSQIRTFNRALEGYEPLPDWAPEEKLPSCSVRTLSADGKQIAVAEGEERAGKEDESVLDFDDFLGDEGDLIEEHSEQTMPEKMRLTSS